MDSFALDQLPYLCWKKIFEFLSLRDLVKYRVVSRQFKFYADEAVNELIVANGEFACEFRQCYFERQNWYLTERSIHFQRLIGPKAFSSVRSSPFKLNERLKFLCIQLTSIADLDFEILNDFKKLIHLEIKIWAGSDNRPKTLALDNLKTLDVRKPEHPFYVLNTPNLEVLACCELERIEVLHPQRIKRLECDYRGETHITEFENLETLGLECVGCDLKRIRLSDWKDLKELNVSLESCYEEDEYEDFKNSLIHIMHQRTASKRKELQLFLEDVRLLDANQLVDYSIMSRPDLFHLKSYKQLRHASYPKRRVQFDYLIKLGVELSVDFFDRFPAIEALTAVGPTDRENFEWFLKNAKALRYLILVNTLLNQTFMDDLPKIISQLVYLSHEESSGLVTDFNFILQFKCLYTFHTDEQVGSLDIVKKAFFRSKKLNSFEFRKDDEHVTIERFSRKRCRLSFYGGKSSGIESGQFRLKWAELTAFYDQRKVTLSAERKKRVKMVRLSESDSDPTDYF